MKTIKILLIGILMCPLFTTQAQENLFIPDLSKISDSNLWTLHNRDLIPGNEVHLNANQGDGYSGQTTWFLKMAPLIWI